MTVLIGAALIFVAGFSLTEGTFDTESNKQQSESQKSKQQEKASKIIDNGIGHHVSIYEKLPEKTKSYLKENPEMLKELVQGPDPAYMNSMNDAMNLLDEVDKKDAKYLYENEIESLHKMVPYGNGEEPPAKEIKTKEKLVQKLKNNNEDKVVQAEDQEKM